MPRTTSVQMPARLFDHGGRPYKLSPAQRGELSACEWLSVEETAQYMGISRKFAYRLVQTGEIPSIRLGGKLLRIKRSDLDAMADRQESA